MARYIDAEKLLAELSNDITRHYFLCDLVDKISCQPIVDLQKEEYCKNISDAHPCDEFICSECGLDCVDYAKVVYDEDSGDSFHMEFIFNFCPNCGKKIDMGDTNES